MMAIRRRPRDSRCSTIARAPPRSSAAAYDRSCSWPSGLPHATAGRPRRTTSSISGSPRCGEISSAPSACPPSRKRQARARSSADSAIIRTSGMSSSASARVQSRSSVLNTGLSDAVAGRGGLRRGPAALGAVRHAGAGRHRRHPGLSQQGATGDSRRSATRALRPRWSAPAGARRVGPVPPAWWPCRPGAVAAGRACRAGAPGRHR